MKLSTKDYLSEPILIQNGKVGNLVVSKNIEGIIRGDFRDALPISHNIVLIAWKAKRYIPDATWFERKREKKETNGNC